MACVDRTAEFFSLTEKHKAAAAATGGLQEARRPSASAALGPAETAFIASAGEIGRELNVTQMKLSELTKLVRSKRMFNDKSSQIDELTYSIKSSLDDLLGKIDYLQKAAERISASSRHSQAHLNNMVTTVRSRHMEATRDFKNALEQRTKNLQQLERRRQMYAPVNDSGGPAATAWGAPTGAPDRDPESGGLLQMQDTGHQYTQSRAEAMENVQKMIAELGQMFQRVAQLVTSQGEMIERIDEDTTQTLENVNQAQAELLKYYNWAKSNRSLIIKVFLVLMFFILFSAFFLF
uniref:t-SNARE coiled-coil homology domain-containing protein n=1 Tax=Chromera velia CCMP2878 TaxID=1169474 RepID=A0A0G4I8Q1_9ALVE|mmetsp:Transcript_29549/g.57968  ORF Transcript_29549/g.57968 Transcript_29549/m.57968 type:complete len:293 (+) Transcript_29549:195-1073(+)|eukprot:Cvel_11918.t1-p1 / transcript=Cvel_11918.t1 / gene=Cvel_11918 / organism=Chromera_velia_CCMP2878 / gene_product=Syntaxin-5, putative / transcript_product=Syntaxin-5, putative / location=Cvel_scaffold763:43205-46747(-) / protein_length=292 / sequence_SO=supercontig / SO=protein_coding / is_pseudo=false